MTPYRETTETPDGVCRRCGRAESYHIGRERWCEPPIDAPRFAIGEPCLACGEPSERASGVCARCAEPKPWWVRLANWVTS